jgi:hypothetical protein
MAHPSRSGIATIRSIGLDSANEYETRSRNGTEYGHGQPIMRDIATNIQLPLPLPLCDVLLLDPSSPVIEKWERSGRQEFHSYRLDVSSCHSS